MRKYNYSRRNFLKTISLGAAAFAVQNPLNPTRLFAEETNDKKPNFIFILVDDLGWIDTGCYGSKFYETPNIDRLAAEGMRFTAAYAACAVCSPTRAAVMTGRYPARLGVTDWIRSRFQGGKIPKNKKNPTEYVGGKNKKLLCPPNALWMELEEITIAEALKPAGYTSCHIGKWHLGADDWYPDRQGFDFNIAGCDFGQPPTYFDPYYRKGQGAIPTLNPRRQGEYLTDREADEAVKFIRRTKDKPFFLYMAHYTVHTPIQAKKDLIKKYKSKTPTNQKNPTYAAMIESLDDAVGRICSTLDELDLAENTIIFFTSDNGGLLGPTNNAPLRSGKGFPYEGGIREPLLVRWPKVIKPAAVSHELVTSVDYFPTICQAAGVPLPNDRDIDGVSLLGHLKSNGTRELNRHALYWHFPHYRGKVVPYSIIREREWKLIKRYEGKEFELFDLKSDLSEKNDLSTILPSMTRQLDAKLRRWLKLTVQNYLNQIRTMTPTPLNRKTNFKIYTIGNYIMKRRDFLKAIGAGTVSMALPGCSFAQQTSANQVRPNILWILSEDISPDLECYGTPSVQTPNLNKLADQGVRFTNAFTTSPVCSTSRSAMITGMHQGSIGAHHHRSHRGDGYVLPEPVKPITEYFRQAGYFTANVKTAAPGVRGSGKTDFNFKFNKPFDGSDWNQRKPGQPFFAQLSIAMTHRGKQWIGLDKKLDNPVNPNKVKLPPYFPDHPIARQDWATYLNSIQMMDQYVGKILQRLEDEGLAKNTVVIFIGDHGRCHVRGKQWLYDAGIRIPLIVRWPGKLKMGRVSEDLVSAIDISATVLKIAGIKPPKHLQGKIFLGRGKKKREYIFASRGRCDETIECIRCVHDKRYSYIRNYMPYRPWMAPNRYKDTSYPMRNLMRSLHAEGKLTPDQAKYMAHTKPPEELYDLKNDPHEFHNLANSPEHQKVLRRMRSAHIKWMHQSGDLGLIPEPILEEIYLKHGNGYNILAQPENQDLIDSILEVIGLSEQGKSAIPQLIHAMQDKRPSIRWWAAIGLGNMNSAAEAAKTVLQKALKDKSASVRVAAARAFCRMGRSRQGMNLLVKELQNKDNKIARHYAALELEELGDKAGEFIEDIRAAQNDSYDGVKRVSTRIITTMEK